MTANVVSFPVVKRPQPPGEEESPVTLASATMLIIRRLEKAIGTDVTACFLERLAEDLRTQPSKEPSK